YKEYQAILSEIQSDDTFDEPTLFIRGENSKYIKDDDVLDIQDLFPMMQLESIKNAGHWVHAENPKIIFGKIECFFEIK
ncbi:MAG: alpha/beta hydrolase, partial [Saprospiraceae bacterium]|nr:alpha/beta hydrolase [Saprospiraceae bacterium]